MRNIKLNVFVVILLWSMFYTKQVIGMPNGAPDSACESMTPSHNVSAQDNANTNYSVEIVGNVTTYSPGTPVRGEFLGIIHTRFL